MADYMTLNKSLQRHHKRGLIEISADRANYCAVEENPGHHNWEGPHGSSIFNDGFAFIYAPDDKDDAFDRAEGFGTLLEAIDYADEKDGIVQARRGASTEVGGENIKNGNLIYGLQPLLYRQKMRPNEAERGSRFVLYIYRWLLALCYLHRMCLRWIPLKRLRAS